MRISDCSSDVCSSDLGHSDFPAGRRVRLPRNRSSKGVCIMTSVSTTGPGPAKLPWWTPGDWNAFFGFGTNILVNVLVLTGLLRFVLKLPDPIIFGRILPAVGMMLFLSTVYYAHLRSERRRVGKAWGRKCRNRWG